MPAETASGPRAFLRFVAASFAANLQSVMEYRVSFALQVFGMALNNATFAYFWHALVARTGTVGGYGFDDIMFIWALVSSSYGIAHVACGNVRSIGRIVVEGELDLYLLQPRDVLANLLVSRTIVSAWGDILYGLVVIALLPGFGPGRLALFAILSLSGAAIFTGVFVMAESMVFFLGNSGGVTQTIREFLISFSLYPESIHGGGTRWMLYSIFPAGFIAFIPLRIYTALDWRLVPAIVLIAAAYAGAGYGLFRLGLARYESGNRIGTRS